MGIVELYGIVGFAQRAFFTGLVDVVAFVDVGDHFVEIDIDTFRPQFVDASLCPSLRRGRDEYFQFGMGEYGRAYIAPVHDDTFPFAHFLLCGDHRRAHERYGTNGAYLVGYSHGANFTLYVDSV